MCPSPDSPKPGSLHPDLPSPDELARLSPEEIARRLGGLSGTLGEKLGVEYLRLTPDEVTATMPVSGNRQPAGRLHGGASAALIEELASVGSWMNLDLRREVAVGVDLNITHVRAPQGDTVTGTARLTYRGRRLLLWSVDLFDERGRLISTGRCSCTVVGV